MGEELPTLRGFSYETAAEHLHTRVPVASRSSPVEEIRRSLGEKGYDSLTHIAILEGTKPGYLPSRISSPHQRDWSRSE